MLPYTILSFLLLILAICSVAIPPLSHLYGRKITCSSTVHGALNCVIPPIITLLHGKWVRVTMAWCIPRVPMVERPPDRY